MITVEFLITSLIVVLIPGTGVVFTVSTGLLRGRRASVFAALGCTAGIGHRVAACAVVAASRLCRHLRGSGGPACPGRAVTPDLRDIA